MIKFLHISDTHFSRASHKNRLLLARLQTIQQQFPEHWIILTGDIVDDGHEKQYAKALEALSPFKGRIFMSPGNHDYGQIGLFYQWECRKRFQKFNRQISMQEYLFKYIPAVSILQTTDNLVMLIGLDSNLRTQHPFDFAKGEVGKRQRKTLKDMLNFDDSRLGKPVMLVYLHHHPFMHSNPLSWLRDSRQLMKLLDGKVDILCFGHDHQARVWQNKDGIPWVVAAGSLRENNQVWEIVIDGQEIVVNEVKL